MKRAAIELVLVGLMWTASATAGPSIAFLPNHDALLVAGAHDDTIEIVDLESRETRWRTAGPRNPRDIVISEDGSHAAVLDPVSDVVWRVDVDGHSATPLAVAATPIDARFSGSDLLVLSRDGRRVTVIPPSGPPEVLATEGADPAFLALAGDRVLVYSRIDGLTEEIALRPLRRVRSFAIPPFAAAFAVSEGRGYVLLPRPGKLVSFDLERPEVREEIAAGAVPVDLVVGSESGLLSPGVIEIADPSSHAIWTIEKGQSAGRAFLRGFIRGLFGLGLHRRGSRELPTGVDRIIAAGNRHLAYDSASRTLYEISGGTNARPLADQISRFSIAVTPRGIAVWEDGTVRIIGPDR